MIAAMVPGMAVPRTALGDAIGLGIKLRRGWTIRWASVVVLGMALAAPGRAEAADPWLLDPWLTRDQQGRLAYERGDYRTAAECFSDPVRDRRAVPDRAVARHVRVPSAVDDDAVRHVYAVAVRRVPDVHHRGRGAVDSRGDALAPRRSIAETRAGLG
jgi:hypothetical protein